MLIDEHMQLITIATIGCARALLAQAHPYARSCPLSSQQMVSLIHSLTLSSATRFTRTPVAVRVCSYEASTLITRRLC